jgi:hypothetical protein
MMPVMVAALIELIRFDRYIVRGAFEDLYERVRRFPVTPRPKKQLRPDEICRAVDVASIWYYKPVLCLQRSAATACLLRRHGMECSFVLGARQLPFRAHAWVEISGHVVNDKPYTPDLYVVLDRC